MSTVKLSVWVMLLAFYWTFLWTVSTAMTTKTQGEDLTMECNTTKDFDGLYVRARIPKSIELLYRDTYSEKVTVLNVYEKRLTYSVKTGKLTITLSNLHLHDSGLYLCEYTSISKKGVTEENNILLFVKEAEVPNVMEANKKEPPTNGPDPLVLVAALSAFAVLMMISLVAVVWIIPKVKRLCKEPQNEASKGGVYEEMHSHQYRTY